jgi:hypothetical protein
MIKVLDSSDGIKLPVINIPQVTNISDILIKKS